MKANPTLATKRLPVRKGVLKRLHAVTGGRKQRVAATANPADLDDGEAGRKITTGLIVIVAVHVVAIALFFIHHRFIEGRVPEVEVVSQPAVVMTSSPRTASGVTVDDLPRLAPGELSHRVEAGDTYAKIAFARGVEESALREANSNIALRPGISLRVPPKKITAVVPEEVTDLRANAPSSDRGRVEPAPADVTNGAPKAKVVKPSALANTPAVATANPVKETEKATPKPATRSYTVQQGDNLWKISKRLKVDQDKLMKANGIEDARKLRVGMTLVVPN
jgi:LysM repeat protein